MTITINPIIFAVVLGILVLTLLLGAGIRQYHYVQFERKRRGGHLAELIRG